MRVLLVEDSDSLRASLEEALRRTGYAVDAVSDGRRGLLNAQTTAYDAIVLDWMLPEVDGLTVLRRLREKGVKTPVLMLTARDTVADRVLGLTSGADDYLVKPFALEELLARVHALARRGHGTASAVIAVGPLKLDTAARTASVRGRTVELTPRDYSLLEYLAHRAGRPVTRAELEEHLYDDRARITSNAVDAAVCALRARLEAAGCPALIHTRRGFGYVLAEVAP